ncbi:MAG: hypothetical protein IT285_02875 [Bdellovibrionales bacterium]|nr:hypothetical protein [Bdellovibrionales bacterium]
MTWPFERERCDRRMVPPQPLQRFTDRVNQKLRRHNRLQQRLIHRGEGGREEAPPTTYSDLPAVEDEGSAASSLVGAEHLPSVTAN